MSDPEKRNTSIITRDLQVRAASFDRSARTVEVVLSTGSRRRMEYWDGAFEEEIPLTAADVRRINKVGPVLDNHRSYGSVVETLGAIERDSVRMEDSGLVGRIKFARTERADTVMQMIEDDIIRAVSVGYSAQYERIRAKDRTDGGDVDLYRATTWEPYEVSVVAMPADVDAIIRGVLPQDNSTASVRSFEEKENMSDRNKAQTPAAETGDPKTQTVNQRDIMAQTAELIGKTRTMLSRHALDVANAEKLVLDCDGDESKIRSAVLDMLENRSAATRVDGHVRVEIGEDVVDKRRMAIVDGLDARLAGRSGQVNGEVAQYSRTKLLDIAKACLEGRGINVGRRSDEEIARIATRSVGDGFHSTSDFSGILSDVANKRLRAAFMAQPPVWKQFARRADFNDFKNINVYKIGDFPDLLPVAEGEEYTNGTLGEASETYRGTKAGRIVALTWEAIINDDLRAFEQGLRGAGQAALRRENKAFYDQLFSASNLSDGLPLFDSARGNISAVGGAPSLTVLSAASTAMSTQAGDSADTTDPLDLWPAFWLCPQKQRMAAQQVVGYDNRRAPNQPSNYVPPEYEGITVLPTGYLDRDDDIISYLIASPAMIDTVEYGYLRGEEGPVLTQDELFRGDGTAFKVRHTFGLKIIEPRAFVRIPAS